MTTEESVDNAIWAMQLVYVAHGKSPMLPVDLIERIIEIWSDETTTLEEKQHLMSVETAAIEPAPISPPHEWLWRRGIHSIKGVKVKQSGVRYPTDENGFVIVS